MSADAKAIANNDVDIGESFKIGLENPVEDYRRLIKLKVETDGDDIDDETMHDNFKKIAAAMQKIIWKLIFDDGAVASNHKKAEEALETYKLDACFHSPTLYNDWIPTVREELIKRNMVKFWKDVVCKKELGLCWAKDCDFFDDLDDPKPKEFYKVSFNSKDDNNSTEDAVELPRSTVVRADDTTNNIQTYIDIFSPCLGHHHAPSATHEHDDVPFIIGMENPATDYKRLIELKVDNASDDDIMIENFNKISELIRNVIWKLLFVREGTIAMESNEKKAEIALEAYKPDACFHNPYAYNEWIPKLRDELLKRKMFPFWKDVIVEKKLGLCWAGDSDLIDDMDDINPAEFYNAKCS